MIVPFPVRPKSGESITKSNAECTRIVRMSTCEAEREAVFSLRSSDFKPFFVVSLLLAVVSMAFGVLVSLTVQGITVVN